MYVLTNGVMILNERELAHYNPNHDKLGRFAKSANATISSTKPMVKPKDYQKRLNKLDRVRTDAIGKSVKATAKGYSKKAAGYKKISQKSAAKIKQVGKEAAKKHYDVKTRDVYRNSERKRDAIVYASLVAASPIRPILPAAGYALVSRSKGNRLEKQYGVNPRAVPGKKYYVYPKR